MKKPRKQQSVSPSARQQTPNASEQACSSPVERAALHDLKKGAAIWPCALAGAMKIRTKYDRICAAYERHAAGAALLSNTLVHFETHALIVVESGEISIESSQRVSVIERGGSALIPIGTVVLSEIPAPGCELRCWIIFFGPPFLQELLHGATMVEGFARRVFPGFSGAYVQQGTLMALHAHKIVTPVCDVKKTFNLLLIMISSSVFMFLRDHFYGPRRWLQELSLLYPEGIKGCFPGGLDAYKKSFKLYHGVPVGMWRRDQQKLRKCPISRPPLD